MNLLKHSKFKSHCSRSSHRERGFSLLEVIVMMFIGMITLAAIWSFFSASLKQSKSTDVRLKGVQGAHILISYLEHDLKRIYHSSRYPLKIKRNYTSGDASLAFFIFDEDRSEPENLRIFVKPIEYRFEYAQGKVSRLEQGVGTLVFRDKYERVVFGYWQTNPGDLGKIENSAAIDYTGMPPYQSASTDPWPNPNVLSYQITCIPEDIFLRPMEDREPKDRTTVCGGVLIPSKVFRQKYEHWVANVSSTPQ